MDKIYAESCGEPAFDWNLFLANPPEEGSLAHYKATGHAINWTTCACGNQCAIIPRDDCGAPVDHELGCLGGVFYHHIKRANWGEARETLAAIEARSAVLIQEELAKLNP